MTEIDSSDMVSNKEKNFAKKILIADDQNINIEALKSILKIYGIDEYKSEESSEEEASNNSPAPKAFGFGNAILISRSSDDFDIK